MGFIDYLYITVFVILIAFIICDLIISAVNSQRIKKISRKIAVKKSIRHNIYWIFLSAVNALLNFDQYKMLLVTDDKRAELRLLAFTAWTICGIFYIAMIFLDKYIYITPDGPAYKTMIKIQPKEKYKYRIDGGTLELYYKKSDTPAKYGISGGKEELLRILDENYAKYTGN